MAVRFLDEQQQIQPKSRIRFLEQIPFLPRRAEVEQRIAQRPDILRQYMQTIQQPGFLGRAVRQPLATTQLQMGAPGALWQRAEAGLAGPALALQRGRPQEIGREFRLGITGERPTEFGDVIRTTAFGGPANELLASTGGLFASIGIIDPLTRGLLVRGTNKAMNFLRSRVPRIMNKDYVINRARIAGSGLDDLYDGLSREYDNLYDRIGNRAVDTQVFQDIINELPPNITTQMRTNIRLFQRARDGSVMPNLSNLKVVKQFIRKAVPKQVLNESRMANQFQGNLKGILTRIRNLMTDAAPELKPLNKRYSEFLRMNTSLRKALYDTATGDIRSKGLEGIWKPGAERLTQVNFEKFVSLWPQAAQVMKDMMKFTGRQAVKAGFRRWGPWIPALGGAGYMGTRLLGRLGGGGGGEYGGQ